MTMLFLDCEWADELDSELVSLALVVRVDRENRSLMRGGRV